MRAAVLIGGVVVASGLSACRVDVDYASGRLSCRDDGRCPAGFECVGGTCVARTGGADRCAGVSCPPGQTCDHVTGRCGAPPGPESCDPLAPPPTGCAEGEKCRPRAGSARGECGPAGSVGAGERCNPDRDDCAVGLWCTSDTAGEAACRLLCPATGADPCPDGFLCQADRDLPGLGTCVPRCRDDGECRPGERCDSLSGRCVEGGCPPGAECIPGEARESPCGRCGRAMQMCGAGCRWGQIGACAGDGECDAGAEEEEVCGNNGRRERRCSVDTCQWSDWSACAGETAQCVPAETQERVCGRCGVESRGCQQNRTWGAWGACQGEGECRPGGTQTCGGCGSRTCNQLCQWGPCSGGGCTPGETRPCGNCGTERCTDQCVWSSDCAGQGECRPGAREACGGTCGGAGERLCELGCTWGSCSAVGAGDCTPGEGRVCGTCGGQTCDPTCLWGECSGDGTPEASEPNDTRETAAVLREKPDNDDSRYTLVNLPNLLPLGDEDYFQVHVLDTPGGDLVVDVVLDALPEDYDLCVTFVPDNAADDRYLGGEGIGSCSYRPSVDDDQVVLDVETDGDDTGAVYIRVFTVVGVSSCETYRITWGF